VVEKENPKEKDRFLPIQSKKEIFSRAAARRGGGEHLIGGGVRVGRGIYYPLRKNGSGYLGEEKVFPREQKEEKKE